MFGIILSCIMLFGISHGEVLPFTVCESGNPPITLAVDPCGDASYVKNVGCVFQQGTQVTVQAAFIAPFTSGQLETISTAYFEGHEIPFPDSGNNACNHLVPGCPILRGRLYFLTYRFNILKYYPTGSMDIEIMVRDKRTKKAASCAKMTIIITENLKN